MYLRRRACTTTRTLPRSSARLKPVKARRPFVRLQVDFYEVSPESGDGYKMVLTTHCVYSRFTAVEVAGALFDVFLDIGVFPKISQSDLGWKFVKEVITELKHLW